MDAQEAAGAQACGRRPGSPAVPSHTVRVQLLRALKASAWHKRHVSFRACKEVHRLPAVAAIFRTPRAVYQAVEDLHLQNREGGWVLDLTLNVRCCATSSDGRRCAVPSRGHTFCAAHAYAADVQPRITALLLCFHKSGLSFLCRRDFLLACLFTP